ncbi:MAG: S-methyl-5-thioribose-1-phosphate isomerase, partial [Methylocella sp.]
MGIAAAYGVALAARQEPTAAAFDRACGLLIESRPTAVNLRAAVDRMKRRHREPGSCPDSLLAEAHAIARFEEEACERIGENGAALVPTGARILTICNT